MVNRQQGLPAFGRGWVWGRGWMVRVSGQWWGGFVWVMRVTTGGASWEFLVIVRSTLWIVLLLLALPFLRVLLVILPVWAEVVVVVVVMVKGSAPTTTLVASPLEEAPSSTSEVVWSPEAAVVAPELATVLIASWIFLFSVVRWRMRSGSWSWSWSWTWPRSWALSKSIGG